LLRLELVTLADFLSRQHLAALLALFVVADGAVVFLGYPGRGYRSPRSHAAECEIAREMLDTPYIVDGVLVEVDDIDAHFERAEAAGATILTALEANPAAGQRQYRVEDVEGHRWMFAEATA
jgi:hypothetical protein